ncbi:uncharacterized protein L3040_005460 [Drepanopeziza brunnea f. sp. 'multigermtubi']|uniref:uncharacterized protein n=1 Tax=Drepanopeziza brunnea f. sp. 'multigermtubi' TaxID=698441 RepID=UPI002391D17A|nr:hypothetical protein L3040_005460 [Drepanopeziza brunnea f. sp. 'multigermtubi']
MHFTTLFIISLAPSALVQAAQSYNIQGYCNPRTYLCVYVEDAVNSVCHGRAGTYTHSYPLHGGSIARVRGSFGLGRRVGRA